MKVLIIEDNKSLAATIRDKLREQYVVDMALTGDKGEYLADTNEYDLILLDLNLPDMDGTQVCQKIRHSGNKVPILALTGRSKLTDKVQTLDAGVDDYLVKPFEFAELLARMRSLLRRGNYSNTGNSKLEIGELSLNTSSQEVILKGKPVKLRRKEYQLLEYLMCNRGRVITRDQIIEHVWDTDTDPITNTVDVHINSLRQKIDHSLIKTIHGIGYIINDHEERR